MHDDDHNQSNNKQVYLYLFYSIYEPRIACGMRDASVCTLHRIS